ncbi:MULTISPECIES: MmcQ/YjbR family DNA-binding protein [Lentzea]|uniref:YjbR protein n=1 Tax=Lentzea albida TaxID=65499 RepID=A0A1H9TPU5_9PSEU|nr:MULTISPECIES: MmcQ/YjbR family DNA-binding protein [Lentzea]USX48947.1 MmcQ/YjbR family DNA-binding protein [Lentzea sp. HUAS12]SER99172.1 YjbR protein [Lentzea albida]
MATTNKQLFRIVDGLAEATRSSGQQYDTFRVRGKVFGYYWPRTQTVGLKQTLSEQLALVAERPDVFEVQFTAGGFGWVVAYLEGVEADEMKELVFEAWRLSAPEELIAQVPDLAR